MGEQETGIASNERPRHPWAKSVRDGEVIGKRAEREIGDDCRECGGDLLGADGVVALGMTTAMAKTAPKLSAIAIRSCPTTRSALRSASANSALVRSSMRPRPFITSARKSA